MVVAGCRTGVDEAMAVRLGRKKVKSKLPCAEQVTKLKSKMACEGWSKTEIKAGVRRTCVEGAMAACVQGYHPHKK